MFGHSRSAFVFATAIQLANIVPAAAEECTVRDLYYHLMSSSGPMTFSVEERLPAGFDYQEWLSKHNPMLDQPPKKVRAVIANGKIERGTTARFTSTVQSNSLPAGTDVYLISPGGDLDEGLSLGRAIRERQFNTSVPGATSDWQGALSDEGRKESAWEFQHPLEALKNQKPQRPLSNGACLSSCTFAFLGGVHRSVDAGAVYGVHQFYFTGQVTADQATSEAQKISAKLFGYVRTMGVDPGFIDEMLKAERTGVNSLSRARLKDLNAITEVKEDRWRPDKTKASCGF